MAKKNITLFLLLLLVTVVLISLETVPTVAASSASASGIVSSETGAYLRQKASTNSAKINALTHGTELVIHKEVFKSKTKTSKKNKWFYVTACGQKGYIRSDCVGNIEYYSVKGVLKETINYRKGPGTDMEKSGVIQKGSSVTVVLPANPVASTKGSSSVWYKIKINKKYFYVTSSKVDVLSSADSAEAESAAESYSSGSDANVTSQKSDQSSMTDSEFISYLNAQGFPRSYRTKLLKLHKKHPEWVFIACKTGIRWSDAIKKESKKGVSAVYKSLPASYRSSPYKVIEKGWYNASKKVVAYYMDPRNFLNNNRIYMFEDLSYRPDYQKSKVVSRILKPTVLLKYGFTTKLFMKAGAVFKVSPVFLAARARQETGGGSSVISGTKYKGKVAYNPYNIGAGSGADPAGNALKYAYKKGWTSQAKAISGGASYIASGYINNGQNSIYFQKFNVANGPENVGQHQYMTNIQAPFDEAYSVKKSYASFGMTNEALTFIIPIYDGMPATTKLP